MRASQSRYAGRNPEKTRAHRMVREAIRKGILIRPDRCSMCQLGDPMRSDGRSGIQAHHHRGYQWPLDVVWLCAKCHASEDRRASGEDCGSAKLSMEQVLEIRRRFRPDANRWHPQGSARHLAKEFGVHASTITRAAEGVHWTAALQEERT